MQAAHFEEPMRQPDRIHQNPIWLVTGAVMLAHVGVACLVSSGVLSSVAPASEHDTVIMASVVMESPAPSAPPAPKTAPTRTPFESQTKPASKPQPQTKSVSPQVQIAPVLSPAAPSDAPPIMPSAAPAPATQPTAPAPLAAGNQRPANNAIAAAVVLPSTSADYQNNPAPPYPRQSKRLGEAGTVVIRVLITAEGRAEKAEVRTSSGYARLDDTALTTVKGWRFVPGQRNGQPEAMWFNVPIRFVLD
jgi:protein TonB